MRPANPGINHRHDDVARGVLDVPRLRRVHVRTEDPSALAEVIQMPLLPVHESRIVRQPAGRQHDVQIRRLHLAALPVTIHHLQRGNSRRQLQHMNVSHARKHLPHPRAALAVKPSQRCSTICLGDDQNAVLPIGGAILQARDAWRLRSRIRQQSGQNQPQRNPARPKNISRQYAWHLNRPNLTQSRSLKTIGYDQKYPAKMQLNVREPRENRGRLRHCNGIQVSPTFRQAGFGKRH